ncbi:circularly permuted type 2 ATP-grasp protein, partial [Roseovarius sp.]
MSETPYFDEMWGHDETLRQPYQQFHDWLHRENPADLRAKQREAEELFRLTGITFNVYGRTEAEERLIPFDIIPRIISGAEWTKLSRGIEQRVRAINAFLHDIYHRQEIIRAGRIPKEMISRNEAFLPHMIGVEPPGGIYTHIVGIDLVRTGPGDFYVL